jgi:hypothetical protein
MIPKRVNGESDFDVILGLRGIEPLGHTPYIPMKAGALRRTLVKSTKLPASDPVMVIVTMYSAIPV